MERRRPRLFKVFALFEDFERQVRQSQRAHFKQNLIILLLFVRELTSRELQEDESGKESDIRCRHLLTRKDDARVHRSRLLLLVKIHIHASATGAVPQTLQKLNHLRVDIVLVLVNMRQCVSRLRHRVVQSRWCRVLDIRCRVADCEQRKQRVAKLRLATTFRTEQIEDREPVVGRSRSHHVAEERGEIETEAHTSVVPINLEQLLCKLLQSNRRKIEMHKLLFKSKELRVVLVYGRTGWQIEVALILQPYYAKFISRDEMAVVENSVAKSVESGTLPSHLSDFRCRLGLLVKVRLQLRQFLLSTLPNEVAQALDFLLELSESDKILLLQFQDFLMFHRILYFI